MNVKDIVDTVGKACIEYYSICAFPGREKVLRQCCADARALAEGEPWSALEIGTFQGVTACVIADYADRVWTIDIRDHGMVGRVIEAAGKVGKVFPIIQPTNEDKAEFIKRLPEIKFAFVDGGHNNGQPAFDLSLLAGVPIVLVDNVEPGFDEVREAVEAARADSKEYLLDMCILRGLK